MTGQHFKEYVETLTWTLRIPKTELSRCIGVSKVTFNRYERDGVPLSKKSRVIAKLREFYIASLQCT